jgi:Ca-activated chloride channel family protein
MLAFLLAMAVLVAAAARPQRTVAVTVDRSSVMLATDVSGSMTATDVKPSRLVAARQAALRFVSQVPRGVSVGVLAFNATPSVLQSPTRDRDVVAAAIRSMTPSGGTATGDAIAMATRSLRGAPAAPGKRSPSAIVVLSDGKSARGIDPVTTARAAGRARIPVYTVALGTPAGTIEVPRHGGGTVTQPVPPDPVTLAAVARVSGGKSFTAATAGGLSQVYKNLGKRLGHKHERRQVTAAFAGGGLALMLAGAAMSLRWFGRLT